MLHGKKIFTGRNMYRHKEKRSPMQKNNIFSDSGAGVKWAVTFSM
jgi:hypothetical protein